MDKQVEQYYPRWMRRWNAWTRRADLAIFAFFSEFGDLLSEAVRDLGYRFDRMFFGSAKDELTRQRAAVGTPDYEYWRHRLDNEKEQTEVPDRW